MSVSLNASSSPAETPLLKSNWRSEWKRQPNGLIVRTNQATNVYSTCVKKVFNRLTDIAYQGRCPTRSQKDKRKLVTLGVVSYVSVGLFLPISIPGAIQKGYQVMAGVAQKASQAFKQRFHHVD